MHYYLPPALFWAITMNKSQKQTVEKGTIAGLTLVCLSQDKWLVDPMVGLMPFDKLFKLGNKRTALGLKPLGEELQSPRGCELGRQRGIKEGDSAWFCGALCIDIDITTGKGGGWGGRVNE